MRSKRSGGSTLLRDPFAVLGASGVLLPVLLSGYNSVLVLGEEYGGQHWDQLRILLKLAALALCALCLLQPLKKLYKVVRGARRRSQMLQHLPGPSYGLLGILPLIKQRHDVHRLVTEWAEVSQAAAHAMQKFYSTPMMVDLSYCQDHDLHLKESLRKVVCMQEYGPIFRVRVVLFQVS